MIREGACAVPCCPNDTLVSKHYTYSILGWLFAEQTYLFSSGISSSVIAMPHVRDNDAAQGALHRKQSIEVFI